MPGSLWSKSSTYCYFYYFMSPGDAGMVRASNLGHLNGASGVRRFAGTWAAQLCHGDHSCNMNHGHRSRKRGMGFAERFIHPPYSLFFFCKACGRRQSY